MSRAAELKGGVDAMLPLPEIVAFLEAIGAK
jgi:hypothetical protein